MDETQSIEDKQVPQSSEGEVERFSASERASMRNVVLAWLKVHKDDPIIVNGKPAVVVPLQSKHNSWWPWSKSRRASSSKSPVVTSSNFVAPIIESTPKSDNKEFVYNQEVKKVADEVKVSWPPATIAQNEVSEIKNAEPVVEEKFVSKPEIPLSLSEVKVPAMLEADDAELLEVVDEKLLPVGGGEIDGSQHEQIVDEVEQNENDKRHHSTKIESIESAIDTPVASVVVPRQKKRWQLPAVTLPNIYRGVWLVWGTLTFIGMISTSVFTYDVARFFAHFTPAPYLVVGNTPVFLSTFDKELQALQTFQSQQVGSEISFDILREQVEVAVVRRQIAFALATEEQVWVSQKAVKAEVDVVVEKAGSLEQVQNTVRDLWGWTLDDYERYVVHPMLVKRALQEKLSEDSVLALEVGQVGNITQFDRYLDSVSSDYRIIFLQK